MYDIYGIGNALVDIDFEVSTQTLGRLGLDRGMMTLADGAGYQLLLEDLDGIKHAKTCGGSAANTVIAATQFGAKCFYSGKVAADASGEYYLQNLIDNKIDTNLAAGPLEPGATGKCIVMVTPDAERTLVAYLGMAEALSEKDISIQDLAQSRFLHIEGFLAVSKSATQAAIKAHAIAKQAGTKTSINLSDPCITSFHADNIKMIIGEGVDMLFCSEVEAMLYTGAKELMLSIEALKNIAKQFIVTLGNRGALMFDGKELITISPTPVMAIDSVGASDMFAGVLLSELSQGKSMREAGNFACHAAGHIVTKFGARFTEQEAKKIKQNYKSPVEKVVE
jgi:sugar/nucleoside kinase (ribokinase family)